MGTSIVTNWMKHRSRLLRLGWPEGVAEASGVSRRVLDEFTREGSLQGISRSARAYVARTMKISVRELELLACGRIGWIDDARRVDLDGLSAVASVRARAPIPLPVPCPIHRGMRIVGRVSLSGTVDPFDVWDPDDVLRVAFHYPGFPDAFAMELGAPSEPASQQHILIFQPLPPGEIQPGDHVLIAYGQSEIITEFAEVMCKTPTMLRLGSADVPLENVHRAARVVGRHKRVVLRGNLPGSD